MAIFTKTRDNLVETICKLHLHDWVEGTTTATGSSTTLKDTSLAAYSDDFFNDQNAWVYIRSGDYAGHWAKISNFAVAGSPAVGTITFAPVAGGTIADEVTYSIHAKFKRDEVVEAINLAIDKVAEKALVWLVDETVTLGDSNFNSASAWAADTSYSLNAIVKPSTYNGFWYKCTTAGKSHATTEPTWGTTVAGTTTDGTVTWTCYAVDTPCEYALPTTFMYVNSVIMADSDGNFDSQPEIPPEQWEIVHSQPAKIRFLKTYAAERFGGHYVGSLWSEAGLTATRKLRIEGLGSPAILTTDASTCSISPAYVVAQAAAYLHMSRVTGSDPDENAARYKACQDQANIERAFIVPMMLPLNSKRVRE